MLDRIASLLRIKKPVIENRGLLWGSGGTVPTNGTDGWQIGAIFQHTDGGAEDALYVNEGSVTSSAFVALKAAESAELSDLSDVGALAYTSGWMLVSDGDSYEETDDIAIPYTGSFALGTFSASTHGSGVALSESKSVAAGFFADDNNAAIGSGILMRAGRFRTLLTYTGGNREQEVASVIGQVNSVAGTNRHNMCGVMGSYELSGSSALTVDGQAWGTDPWVQAAVIGRVGVGSAKTTLNSNGILAGLAAMSNTASFAANNGYYTGLFVGKWASVTDWGYGIVIDGNAVTVGMQVGFFASSAATTSAVPFDTAQDIYGDGQLSTVEIHGSSASNLTSGYSAKCLRARHIVNTSSGTAAHETYGAMGQLVVKDTTLTHLHSGVIGTFEGHTSGVVSTPAYRYGTACVEGRLGGGGAITATTPIAGFSAIFNGAALASGSSVAYAVTNTGAGEWDYVLGVTHAGTGVHNGVEIIDGLAGDTGAEGKVGYDALMKIDIGGTAYYIALFDAGSVTGEA